MEIKSKLCSRWVAFLLAAILVLTQAGITETVFGASTETAEIYVQSLAPSGGDGSLNAPFNDLSQAFAKVKDGGTIIIIAGYTSKTKVTTPNKKITIKGDTSKAYWTVRGGITLGGDLTLDSIRLETISTSNDERCIYVNGYQFTMTSSTECFVNENELQKAYIYAGSENGQTVTGRKAKIDLGGGKFSTIYANGANDSVVEQGVEIRLHSNAAADHIKGIASGREQTSLNIETKQYFRSSLEQIGALNIASGVSVTVYQLNDVGNVSLEPGAVLKVTSQEAVNLKGDFIFNGKIICDSNINAAGKITGNGKVALGYTGRITGSSDSNATIDFDGVSYDWEMINPSPGVWISQKKDKSATVYLNGSSKASDRDGSADKPYLTMTEVLENTKNSDKSKINIIVSGDTEETNPILFKNKDEYLIYSHDDAVLKFSDALTVSAPLKFKNISLDFQKKQEAVSNITIEGGSLNFDKAVKMVNPPDIETKESSSDNDLRIASGTYGNIIDRTKKGNIDITDCVIEGAVSGWELFNISDLDSKSIIIKGSLTDIEWLLSDGYMTNLYLEQNAEVKYISAPGLTIHLLSGKKLRAESLNENLNLTVGMGPDGKIEESTYLSLAEEPSSKISLVNTSGYILKSTKANGRFDYLLKAAAVLDTPKEISLSYDGALRVTWKPVEHAKEYKAVVYRRDNAVGDLAVSEKIVSDCSYEVTGSLIANGQYYAKVIALGDGEIYAESEVGFSSSDYIHKLLITVISFQKENIDLNKGSEVVLKAAIAPENASNKALEWISSNPAVAAVDKNGRVTAKEAGVTTIRAIALDGSGVSGACRVTVPGPIKVTSIKLDRTTMVLKRNTAGTLRASVYPSNAANRSLTWKSSNTAVATVDQKGTVTAKKGGTAVITAVAKDGSRVSMNCKVTVPYTIKYVLNGGNNNRANSAVYQSSAALKNPTRSGYLFTGWYKDSRYKTRVTTVSGSDYTLYAKWQKVSAAKTSIKSLKKTSKTKLKVTYKKVSGAKGYQITYSTSQKFKGKTTKSITTNTTSKTLTKLKKGKKYYVKVRAYKTDSTSKKVYGKYSAVKSKK